MKALMKVANVPVYERGNPQQIRSQRPTVGQYVRRIAYPAIGAILGAAAGNTLGHAAEGAFDQPGRDYEESGLGAALGAAAGYQVGSAVEKQTRQQAPTTQLPDQGRFL